MTTIVSRQARHCLLQKVQTRFKSVYKGKAAPDTQWTGLIIRRPDDEYWASRVIDEDRYWNTMGITAQMYKQLHQYRWEDDPKGPRMNPEEWQVVPGDIVQVCSGADKGQRGKVVDTFHAANKLKVEGVRLKKRRGMDPQTGQALTQFAEAWVDYYEVKLIDPVLDEPVDVTWMDLEDPATGEVKRFRVSNATGTTIPISNVPATSEDDLNQGDSKKDTPLDTATQITLEDGKMSSEINAMALVKLKVIEEWFIKELEKCHTKDQHLRDTVAAEKKEFQYYTYHKALKMLYDRVKEEEPDLLDDVAALRLSSRDTPPGVMPDFTKEQERYRELRRAARFQLRHEMRPSDVESLAERHSRTTQRGTHLQLHAEVRRRFERGAMSRYAKTRGANKGVQKIRAAFKMKPLEYINDALEIESQLREQLELGQGKIHQQETYLGWKPSPLRKRDQLDEFDNRFGHMSGVMDEYKQLQNATADTAGQPPGPDQV
ncbi:hypothetical protein DIPPA_10729 [Diplonema papillatum]|nr:hypothetical protein DIPPA_10729 [Diplonema papillatum]